MISKIEQNAYKDQNADTIKDKFTSTDAEQNNRLQESRWMSRGSSETEMRIEQGQAFGRKGCDDT